MLLQACNFECIRPTAHKHARTCKTSPIALAKHVRFAHTQIYTNFFAHALAKHVLRTHTNLNKRMHCETFRFAHAHTCVNMLLTCTLAGNMLRRLRNDPAMDANDQPVRFRTLSPCLSFRLLLSLPRGSRTCTVYAHTCTQDNVYDQDEASRCEHTSTCSCPPPPSPQVHAPLSTSIYLSLSTLYTYA